jgi:hypothetical protein
LRVKEKLLALMMYFHQEKILKKTYLQVEEKSWRENIFKWCKNLGVDSSSSYYTLKLGQAKEYNTQVRFGTWSVDVDLSNHIKNKFANSLSYHFTLNILIILFVIVFILINLYYLLILVILLIHFLLGVIVVLILKQQISKIFEFK